MSAYPAHEIDYLLNTAALKAEASYTPRGFEKMSRSISSGENPYGVYLTARYLRESVLGKIRAAYEKHLNKVGLNRNYIDTIAIYLGFPHFEAFKDTCKEIQNQLTNSYNTRYDLIMLYHPDDENYLYQKYEALLETERLRFLWVPVRTEHLAEVHKAQQRMNESLISFLFISDKWNSEKISNLFHRSSKLQNHKKVFSLPVKEVTRKEARATISPLGDKIILNPKRFDMALFMVKTIKGKWNRKDKRINTDSVIKKIRKNKIFIRNKITSFVVS